MSSYSIANCQRCLSIAGIGAPAPLRGRLPVRSGSPALMILTLARLSARHLFACSLTSSSVSLKNSIVLDIRRAFRLKPRDPRRVPLGKLAPHLCHLLRPHDGRALQQVLAAYFEHVAQGQPFLFGHGFAHRGSRGDHLARRLSDRKEMLDLPLATNAASRTVIFDRD